VDELLIATVSKALCHRWTDAAGEIYTVRHDGGSRWTCAFKQCQPQQIVPLVMDAEKHVIWWGSDHFFDISELCSDTDKLSWYNVDDVGQHLPGEVWCRHYTSESNLAASKECMMRLIAKGPPPYPARLGMCG